MTASIRKRFAFTVGANIFRSLLSFATGMLLARWLGPTAYGNMAFLLGTFLGIRQVLDLGSSAAFFTFMSQKRRSRRFVGVYFSWLGLQFLVCLCVVGLMFPSRWIETIWLGEQRVLVLLAFAAAFMQGSVWPVFQQAGESQRQTLWVQGIGAIVASVHLIAIVLLWALGILGLYAIFVAIALEYLLAAMVACRRFSYTSAGEGEAADDALLPVFRKYLRYCLPLIPYSLTGFAYEFADRWLLQRYGGGAEQAYYAVGAQIAAVSLIATTSILNIFWKEISEAHHRGDHARTGVLYRKVSRLLFLVGAFIAGYFIPWSAALLQNIPGAAYAAGATTLAIMFLYPIHQSMGQIGGTMLYATERVSLQVVAGIVFMVASMGATYLVLSPRDAVVPGLGLASGGLAAKMVVMQLIQVNVVAYLIARIWKWRFDWVYQPVALLGCVGSGWMAQFVVAGVFGRELGLPLEMALASVAYILATAAYVYAMPWLAGATREELLDEVRHAWHGTLRLCGLGPVMR